MHRDAAMAVALRLVTRAVPWPPAAHYAPVAAMGSIRLWV